MNRMISLFAAALLLFACKGTEPDSPAPAAPTIHFSAPELVVSPEGGEATVKVESTASWNVSTDGQEWFGLVSSAQVYSGESLLKVSAQPNNTSAPRTGTLTFTSGESKATLQVSQASFVPELRFALTEVGGSGAGGEQTVGTTANTAWTVVDEDIPYWFTLSPKTISKGEGELKIKYLKSYVAEECSVKVRFRSGEYEQALTVKQAAGEPVEEGQYVPAGYTLVWQDDFSEASDHIVDNWRFENWHAGYVNNELQTYIPDDRRTAYTENGALHIVARKSGNQVISARMNSRQSWQYAYVEAAIWLPKGKGTWPAFWMMPDDFSKGWPACGEIDIMEEVGVDANITSSSIHCNAYNHVKNTQKTAARTTAGAEDEFHVYALEWTADYIRTFVDGEKLLEFKNDKNGNDDTWPFNKKFYVILNLAWGGDWGGYKGVDDSALPCTMKVDYVRVYKK